MLLATKPLTVAFFTHKMCIFLNTETKTANHSTTQENVLNATSILHAAKLQ